MKKSINLPKIKKINNLPYIFPSDWQTVIFRNFGMVTPAKIAKVLNTGEDIIIKEAEKLGLKHISYNEEWETKGYITLIKNNWHILSYRQICELLNINEKQLAYILKEDDFLDVKLGNFKPYIKEPKYYLLNYKQLKQTEKIKQLVLSNYIKYEKAPFDFFNYKSNAEKSKKVVNQKKDTIIYSYFALYGDTLINETNDSYPDWLLKKYASLNINSIWLQGLLNQLSEYPFDKSISEGYQLRRRNLNRLIERCNEYGIKVYLYLNEPRAMPKYFFKNREHLQGAYYENLYSLCTSKKEVKQYLYTSLKDLFKACPDLGGIITITMSENLTHCYSKSYDGKCYCPICKEKNVEEVAVEINNIFSKALKDSGSSGKIIANLWGWDEFMGWDIEKTKKGISLLHKDIDVMLVSENSMKINKGGIESTVIDYSISNVGPSERSSLLFDYSKELGHRTYAKVQINNSWECSAVPYIPVFDLIKKHIINLDKLNIDGLMLSWTLGGYPGGGLDYISKLSESGFNDHKWYIENYGDNSNIVKEAIGIFSRAFESFPFCLDFLYNGPHNIGSANLWYAASTGLKSTMVGFPYDDIDGWRGVFSKETLLDQLKKLSEEWKNGIELLNTLSDNSNNKIIELKTISNTCYAHFSSSYLICNYIDKRDKYNKTQDTEIKKEIIDILDKERENTLILYRAHSKNPFIGFEATNHYFYNENRFLEKLVNIKNLKDYFLNK